MYFGSKLLKEICWIDFLFLGISPDVHLPVYFKEISWAFVCDVSEVSWEMTKNSDVSRWCLASHFMTACLCGICSCSKLKTSSFAHILFVPFCLGHTHHSSGGTQAETEGQLSKYYSGSRKLSVEPIAVYKLLLEHRKKGRYPEDTVDMQGNIQSKNKVTVAWATYYLFLK